MSIKEKVKIISYSWPIEAYVLLITANHNHHHFMNHRLNLRVANHSFIFLLLGDSEVSLDKYDNVIAIMISSLKTC